MGLEGNVEGVMERPIGDGADVQGEKEKWYVNCSDYTFNALSQ